MSDWHLQDSWLVKINIATGLLAAAENPVKEVCHGRELGMISGDFGTHRARP